MPVVSDTPTINYLILIGEERVLQHLFGQVVIPEAVRAELSATKAPRAVRQWCADPPEWLRVERVQVPPDSGLASLDLGEREAIAIPP